MLSSLFSPNSQKQTLETALRSARLVVWRPGDLGGGGLRRCVGVAR